MHQLERERELLLGGTNVHLGPPLLYQYTMSSSPLGRYNPSQQAESGVIKKATNFQQMI